MAIADIKGQGWRTLPTRHRKACDIGPIKLNPGWDQLRAQRSVTSMGSLYLVTYRIH